MACALLVKTAAANGEPHRLQSRAFAKRPYEKRRFAIKPSGVPLFSIR
jgi:hypothetical protein